MNQTISTPLAEGPAFTRDFLNLADSSLGAAVLEVSDDFFASADRMLIPAPAKFIPDLFDNHGKWMDGWESRRRRDTGHDYCVLRLALPGFLKGVDIDTSFFTGNFPPAASIEACWCPEGDPNASTSWQEILPAIGLSGGNHHFHAIAEAGPWTHLRLNMFPDGGIARLRVYGQPHCDWNQRNPDQLYDLLALANGGDQVSWSDAHYSQPRQLLRPGRGVNMGDGWETRRRREPGNEWCILKLGHKGVIESVEVDTAHFKGNFPASCTIQAACIEQGTVKSITTQSLFWRNLLDEQPLTADAVHVFKNLNDLGPITHIRFNIIPDGGVSRVRLWGKPVR